MASAAIFKSLWISSVIKCTIYPSNSYGMGSSICSLEPPIPYRSRLKNQKSGIKTGLLYHKQACTTRIPRRWTTICPKALWWMSARLSKSVYLTSISRRASWALSAAATSSADLASRQRRRPETSPYTGRWTQTIWNTTPGPRATRARTLLSRFSITSPGRLWPLLLTVLAMTASVRTGSSLCAKCRPN